MIYLATFLSSALFGYWATRINPKTNRGLVVLCSIISILLPSILAGMRDITIGTDIKFYVLDAYEKSLRVDTFQELLPLIWKIETGFLLLVFAVTKMFGDIQWLLFFIELIIMICMYVGAWRFKDEVPLPVVLLVYFFMYYNLTYNSVRQSIAMSIIFVAIKYLVEKKYALFFLFVVIATSFHTTAVMAVLYIGIHFFLESSHLRKQEKAKTMRLYILVVFSLLFCAFLPQIIKSVVEIGILDSKYLVYVQNKSVGDKFLDNIIYLVELVFILLFLKKDTENDRFFTFFKANFFVAFIMLQLTHTIWNGDRIGVYFSFINIILLAKIPQMPRMRSNRGILNVGLVAIMLFYWVYIYVIVGSSETYPYIPFWEGQLLR